MPLTKLKAETMDQLLSDFNDWEDTRKTEIMLEYQRQLMVNPRTPLPTYAMNIIHVKDCQIPSTKYQAMTTGWEILFYHS